MLSGVLGTLKAKAEFWFWVPRGFCAKEVPKGVTPSAAPLCPLPKPNPTVGTPVPVALAPTPKALPATPWGFDAPKVKGAGAEPPNTELPVPLLVV